MAVWKQKKNIKNKTVDSKRCKPSQWDMYASCPLNFREKRLSKTLKWKGVGEVGTKSNHLTEPTLLSVTLWLTR